VTNIRLLPVVILVISALLVLKTVGLVTNGGYVLTGVSLAQAAGGGGGHGGGSAPAETPPGDNATLPAEPTLTDASPTLSDSAPTMGETKGGGGHGAPAPTDAGGGHGDAAATGSDAAAPATDAHGQPIANTVAAENACDPRPASPDKAASTADGQLMIIPGDCPPLTDAVPQLLTDRGPVPMTSTDSVPTEQVLLERLSTRRADLDAYEQELAMRASLVEAAEKRIEERTQTLQALEGQIAALVEERKKMEEGQFAELVAMYSNMKPKDAASIFNDLDMNILVRVAKQITPRKMSPILAAMTTARAQELTVRLASLDGGPVEEMSSSDLAALPQIVGQ